MTSPTRRFAILPAVALFALFALCGCTTIDAGPNFVVPEQSFDPDFFYCHVEPEFLVAKKCGGGDTGAGDTGSGCHFNSSAVSGMALVNHPIVDCGGGNHPVGTVEQSARGNLQAASLEMSRDYLTAPIFVRPTGNNHPRAIFPKDDPVVDVLKSWASR